MQGKKRTTLLLVGALSFIAVMTSMAALRSQDQSISPEKARAEAPEVFNQAPEPTDGVELRKRKIKNRRYNKEGGSPLTDLPDGGGSGRGGDAVPDPPPPLPVSQSDAIVLATVNTAQPYLTENKADLYTEFLVQVEEVFKDDSRPAIVPGNSITVDQPAGVMRLRDGRVISYSAGGVGQLPRVGRRYVLFLQRTNGGEDLSILTGYELRQGRTFPLDTGRAIYSPQTGRMDKVAPFENFEESSFLDKVRSAIVTSSQDSSEKRRANPQ